MAEVVMVNGKPETILRGEELVRLVERDMGEDVARYVRGYFLRSDEMLEEVRQQAEELSDLDGYLLDLEENADTFREIVGICKKAQDELCAETKGHRLFMKNIGGRLDRIIKLAENQI